VFHIHSFEEDRSPSQPNASISKVEALGLSEADQIVTVSEITKSRIARRHGVSLAKVDVVYNGVKRREAAISLQRNELPTIGFLGRVTAQKGPKTFVEMARNLRCSRTPARYRMAGSGNLPIAVKSLVRAHKMSDSFVFDGFLSPDNVPNWFSQLDLLVVPSAYEPFGIVALEAVQARVPVVINQEAGVCEVMQSLVKVPHHAVAYANAVRTLISDPQRMLHITKSSLTELSNISWDAAANALFHIYQNQFLPWRRNIVASAAAAHLRY